GDHLVGLGRQVQLPVVILLGAPIPGVLAGQGAGTAVPGTGLARPVSGAPGGHNLFPVAGPAAEEHVPQVKSPVLGPQQLDPEMPWLQPVHTGDAVAGGSG